MRRISTIRAPQGKARAVYDSFGYEIVELGTEIDSNLSIAGRPVLRICFDVMERPVEEPYDVNLAGTENQSLMIAQIMDYR